MIQATVDRFEEKYAILVFENGDTVNIHIDELPDGTTEGSVIFFHPSLEEELQNKKEDLAKSILNHILKKN